MMLGSESDWRVVELLGDLFVCAAKEEDRTNASTRPMPCSAVKEIVEISFASTPERLTDGGQNDCVALYLELPFLLLSFNFEVGLLRISILSLKLRTQAVILHNSRQKLEATYGLEENQHSLFRVRTFGAMPVF